MEKIHISLTGEERKELEQFSSKGVHSVKLVNRAKIILALDTPEGGKAESQDSIAQRVGVCRQTVINARRDFLSAGNVAAFLQRKRRETPPVPAKMTGEVEARIIALACGPVPKGRARWTLQLLADRSVELGYVESLSDMSVQRLLKKHNLNRT